MNRFISVIAFIALAIGSQTLFAQWPKFTPQGTPRSADGTVDMRAPAPRTADGKVDLSGVWQTIAGRIGGRGRAGAPAPVPVAAEGTGELPPSGSLFGNIGDQTQGGAPYQPWAAELVKKRMADNSKDNPDAHCLPLGIMQNTTHPFPKKIIQTPSEVIVIYEGSATTVREIYLDGRTPDPDAEPWYQGYSVGRWEGDTLVVETSNFIDDDHWTTWLDVRGSPLTRHGKLTERFRRPNFGSLQIEVTIDDPKAYTKPFTATINNRLQPDTQLIEFVCLDKSAQHYVGVSGVPDAASKKPTQGR
ncbi:MAG TPA: hypothetical protein VFO58_26085 [Vicinamibacterales bacterium]|nr:hypothetical protein [Vicinamibacterales bacterium]